MRLTIRHRAVYHYAEPVAVASHTLRLTPRSYEALAVHAWSVYTEPPRELPRFIDGFGNITHTQAIQQQHSSIAIHVTGEVETLNTYGVVRRGAPEPLPPLFFTRPTRLTAADAAIATLAAEAARGNAVLKRLHALLNLIRDEVDWTEGGGDSVATAAETLAAQRGTAGDLAHVFIAAARFLAIPARYIGGYLWTSEEAREYQGGHAWAEAFVPDLGWVGFDPSHRLCPTEAYIRTSVGLDYWSAAAVRSVHRGSADKTLDESVRVMQLASQQQ